MKKAIFLFILAFSFTTAHAEDFNPTRLTLSAPLWMWGEFNKVAQLEIPVTLTGTPATVLFCVFTKDMGLE